MAGVETDVAIVGGGPFGLMLAIELGRRGVRVVLVDAKPSTAVNPQANATQARTMEHFRRLGLAARIRALGLPEDFPTDIAYYTRFAGHELARLRLPTARQARERVQSMGGSWSAAELPHRVSQKFVEAVLRETAEALPGVSLAFGTRMTAFAEHPDHVELDLQGPDGPRRLTARYLAAGDGSRSMVRQALGFRLEGEGGVSRDFFGGRMLALYLDAPEFYRVVPHDPAWMNVTFNPQRRALMAAVNGRGEFAFHTQLKPGEDEGAISDAQAIALFHAAVGREIPARMLSRGAWTAGFALVADRFQRGRVFLGGDAVHLFTPAGGLGYNTAVEDAVNLGWKLAAAVRGVAGPGLLASYEAERRPAAIRNTGYARRFAASLGEFVPVPEIEDVSPAGAAARQAAGAYLDAHARAEFNIPGITFGTRYDGTALIAPERGEAPPDQANAYVPTARPGGRAPHLWLAPGLSLYDRFGFDWTLLRIGPAAPDAAGFVRAAAAMGLRLTVLDLDHPEAAGLYEAPLALIRPDQVVAWRGTQTDAAPQVLARALGFAPATA